MAVKTHWLSDSFLNLCYYGEVSGRDLNEVSSFLSSHSSRDDVRCILSDWREAHISTITLEDVEVFASYISSIAKTNPRVCHASVMYSNNEYRQSLFSLYNMITVDSPWKIEAFKSKEKALEWLNSTSLEI